MPAKKTTGGISAADVDAKLPRTLFVKRGDIRAAFGFTREEVGVLIGDGTFVAKYPFGKTRREKCAGKMRDVESRQRFLRGQVMAVAWKWEAAA